MYYTTFHVSIFAMNENKIGHLPPERKEMGIGDFFIGVKWISTLFLTFFLDADS